MNAKLVITCGFPSCSTSKSSALRSVTAFPLLSLTTAFTCTRFTLIRMTPSDGGACCTEDCVVETNRMADIAIAIQRKVFMHAPKRSSVDTVLPYATPGEFNSGSRLQVPVVHPESSRRPLQNVLL